MGAVPGLDVPGNGDDLIAAVEGGDLPGGHVVHILAVGGLGGVGVGQLIGQPLLPAVHPERERVAGGGAALIVGDGDGDGVLAGLGGHARQRDGAVVLGVDACHAGVGVQIHRRAAGNHVDSGGVQRCPVAFLRLLAGGQQGSLHAGTAVFVLGDVGGSAADGIVTALVYQRRLEAAHQPHVEGVFVAGVGGIVCGGQGDGTARDGQLQLHVLIGGVGDGDEVAALQRGVGEGRKVKLVVLGILVVLRAVQGNAEALLGPGGAVHGNAGDPGRVAGGGDVKHQIIIVAAHGDGGGGGQSRPLGTADGAQARLVVVVGAKFAVLLAAQLADGPLQAGGGAALMLAGRAGGRDGGGVAGFVQQQGQVGVAIGGDDAGGAGGGHAALADGELTVRCADVVRVVVPDGEGRRAFLVGGAVHRDGRDGFQPGLVGRIKGQHKVVAEAGGAVEDLRGRGTGGQRGRGQQRGGKNQRQAERTDLPQEFFHRASFLFVEAAFGKQAGRRAPRMSAAPLGPGAESTGREENGGAAGGLPVGKTASDVCAETYRAMRENAAALNG